MLKIKMLQYKGKCIYFKLFEIINETERNWTKKKLLEKLHLSYSSLARCNYCETRATTNIYELMCIEFSLKEVDLNEIIELTSEIYDSVYYKLKQNYNNYLEKLDELIKERVIVFPILMLFKLFILVNSIPIQVVQKEYREHYLKLKVYKDFFVDEIYGIYVLVELIFETEVKHIKNHIYNDELFFQILSVKNFEINDYNASLLYAEKAEKEFEKNKNFIRVISTNLTKIACLNHCQEYKEAYKLAKSCFLGIRSLNRKINELFFVELHYLLATIGLKRYKEAISILKEKEKFNMNDCLAYVIIINKSNNKIDKSILEKTIAEGCFVEDIKNYIENNDRNYIFNIIDQYNLSGVFKTLI